MALFFSSLKVKPTVLKSISLITQSRSYLSVDQANCSFKHLHTRMPSYAIPTFTTEPPQCLVTYVVQLQLKWIYGLHSDSLLLLGQFRGQFLLRALIVRRRLY